MQQSLLNSKVPNSEGSTSSKQQDNSCNSGADTYEDEARYVGLICSEIVLRVTKDCFQNSNLCSLEQNSPSNISAPASVLRIKQKAMCTGMTSLMKSREKTLMNLFLQSSRLWKYCPRQVIDALSVQSMPIFFTDLLQKHNLYCCWSFKYNHVRKEGSKKRSALFFKVRLSVA